QIQRGFRLNRRWVPTQRAIECHGSLQLWVVRCIKPGLSPPAAESHDSQPGGAAAIMCSPVGRGIQVGHVLRVRRLRYHLAEDLAGICHLRQIAYTRVILCRYREVSSLRPAPTDILDIFMDAENLLI